ncbi:glycosyltransferase family 4 protein [Motiliproteus sp. SC1-56]|uniref:glycosyltransferase family 4 protein n=1 Tax=Motiliproteus sp. SC1-56 TaxID=2799565 RepID=UPI001A90A6B1|nr:glycosyltransferase family 4 protein [Motiliproteus sp. SC1-56]
MPSTRSRRTRYLFVHQNFPGQFPHIARALAERGDEVMALGETGNVSRRPSPHPRIKTVGYPAPEGAGSHTHQYLRGLEAHVRRGQTVLRACLSLKRQGFQPDVVIAHPGWGEALFLKEAWPQARHIHYLEFYYQTQGADVGFDPAFPDSLDDRCRVRIKNATQQLSFEAADAAISPTAWQKSRFPPSWQHKIHLCHDGIDTARIRPDEKAQVQVGGQTLTREQEVVTFVARNLEPYRGFHTFMQAVPLILEQRPQAHILIVGGDGVSYGKPPADAASYREQYVAAWGNSVDHSRVHFLGHLPYADYLRVLQISALHVYLTYPFVLSWSMLEAMSAGCLVLGSDTKPVREVIRDGDNGFLTDFFDAQALASRAASLLANRQALTPIRAAARETACTTYDLQGICLPRILDLLAPHPILT